MGAALAPTTLPGSEGEYSELQGQAFLADGRVLVLWADGMDSDDNFNLCRSSLYDSKTDTWAELAPPWAYDGGYANCASVIAMADGDALALRNKDRATGSSGAGTQSAVFDAPSGEWLPPVDVPTHDPVSANGVVLNDGRILLFGIDVARTYLFDPATGSWDAGPALPFDGRTSAVLLGDGSVLALSADGRSARLPTGGDAWLRTGTADIGDGAEIAVILGGAIALGGHKHCGDFSCLDSRSSVYRTDTRRWSPGPDSPDARAGSAHVLLTDGRLLVAGGWGGGTDYSCVSLASILSADATTWQSIEPIPACMAYGAGRIRADGSVLIAGSGDVYSGDVDMGVGIVALSYVP